MPFKFAVLVDVGKDTAVNGDIPLLLILSKQFEFNGKKSSNYPSSYH